MRRILKGKKGVTTYQKLTQYFYFTQHSFRVNHVLESLMDAFNRYVLLRLRVEGREDVAVSTAAYTLLDLVPLVNSYDSVLAFKLSFILYF